MKLVLAIFLLSASPAFSATGNPQARPPHQSCTWCHVPAVTPQSPREQPTKLTTQINSGLCMSCHDGNIGPGLTDVHMVHSGRFPNEPNKCLDCHDPHDRTGSYMQLRGKHGPETEQSWMLGFCRGCHTDH